MKNRHRGSVACNQILPQLALSLKQSSTKQRMHASYYGFAESYAISIVAKHHFSCAQEKHIDFNPLRKLLARHKCNRKLTDIRGKF